MNSLSRHSHALRKICLALSLVWSTGGAVASTLEKTYTATILVDWESISTIDHIDTSIIRELISRGVRTHELPAHFSYTLTRSGQNNYQDIYDKNTGELLYRLFFDVQTGRFWILILTDNRQYDRRRGSDM